MEKLQLKNLLKEVYHEIDKQVTFSYMPKTVNEVKLVFLESIPQNDYFTRGEKKALSLYLQSHNNFITENIRSFTLELDEGIASWFKSGVEKVKKVFSSIKDYVKKIWGEIKTAWKKFMKFALEDAKKMFEKIKEKLKQNFKKIIDNPEHKKELISEVKDSIDIGEWIKFNFGNILNKFDDKVENEITQKIEKTEEKSNKEKITENIFNKELTKSLINNTLLFEAEGASKWKKWVFNIIKIILNPVMGTIGVMGSFVLTKLLDWVSLAVSKLGGPSARKFHIIPEIVFAGLELSGAYNALWHVVEEFLEIIPGLNIIIKLWEIGHYILLGYAAFEIIKEVAKSLKLIQPGEIIGESEFLRMQKLAGII